MQASDKHTQRDSHPKQVCELYTEEEEEGCGVESPRNTPNGTGQPFKALAEEGRKLSDLRKNVLLTEPFMQVCS